jgi:hypothetical protein
MPPLPWTAGQVITESFLTGAPIFIPESEEEKKGDAALTPVDVPQDAAVVDEVVNPAASNTTVPPAWNRIGTATDTPAVTSDTYSTYREYRKQQVQEQRAPVNRDVPVNVGTGGLY